MLVLYSFEFLSYPSKHWNSGPIYKDWTSDLILPTNGILVLFLQTCQNSDVILQDIGVLALFLETLEFWSYFYNIGFLILCFQTVELWPYFANIGILILSFQTLEFMR